MQFSHLGDFRRVAKVDIRGLLWVQHPLWTHQFPPADQVKNRLSAADRQMATVFPRVNRRLCVLLPKRPLVTSVRKANSHIWTSDNFGFMESTYNLEIF